MAGKVGAFDKTDLPTFTGPSPDPDITFFLSDASTTEGAVTTRKVFVSDGKIDGVFPSGMGTSEYILTLGTPQDSLIYAGATFDPQTLIVNSRFLGISGSGDYPEGRIDENGGFLYWLLGFTYFDSDGDFRVTITRVGDIHTELIYGALNARPAIWAGDENGWLDLESLFP